AAHLGALQAFEDAAAGVAELDYARAVAPEALARHRDAAERHLRAIGHGQHEVTLGRFGVPRRWRRVLGHGTGNTEAERQRCRKARHPAAQATQARHLEGIALKLFHVRISFRNHCSRIASAGSTRVARHAATSEASAARTRVMALASGELAHGSAQKASPGANSLAKLR